MSQFRKFAIAIITLSVIAGATVAANGIEVLVQGIEVLSPTECIAHTQINHAPVDAMAFAVWNDGVQDHVLSMVPISPVGTTPVYFPIQSPTNRVVVGYMTPEGIEVLAASGIDPYEGIWELD